MDVTVQLRFPSQYTSKCKGSRVLRVEGFRVKGSGVYGFRFQGLRLYEPPCSSRESTAKLMRATRQGMVENVLDHLRTPRCDTHWVTLQNVVQDVP